MQDDDPNAVTLADALVNGTPTDVRVVDGRVHSLHPAGSAPASALVHQLGGRTLLPAFCDPHVHLDKVLTSRYAPTTAVGLSGAIDAHRRVIDLDVNTHDHLVARGSAMLDRLLLLGVTAVRTHVNVGEGLGLDHFRAMRSLLQRYRPVMDLQLVAMVHTPVTGVDGAVNREWLRKVLEDMSPDAVGGCPHLDPDPLGALDVMFDAAVDSGLPIDLHTDETTDPTVFTLPHLAERTDRAGWHGRVSASHCVSLGMQSLEVQRRTAAALAQAGVAVVALPQTNLYLNSVGISTAPARGIAPLTVLRDAGVLVAAGSDNLQDPFNPVGDADPLHTASLLVTAAHQLPADALLQVGAEGRQALGLEPAGVSPGMVADLVALPATDPADAIATSPADRLVFRGGSLVASTSVERRLTF